MNIVLVGAGGHCIACVDVIAAASGEIAGVLDSKAGAAPAGIAWLGTDAWMDSDAAAGAEFLVTVGQVRLSDVRRKLFDALVGRARRMATVSSPFAIVSGSAVLGRGTIVMHRAVVNAEARWSRNALVARPLYSATARERVSAVAPWIA